MNEKPYADAFRDLAARLRAKCAELEAERLKFTEMKPRTIRAGKIAAFTLCADEIEKLLECE